MAPTHSKLTIHPWLDTPIYNRIRYPQWKIYLYNAAQKMCTSSDPTCAYCLVARNADWNVHPKNIIPARPATPGATLHPATIRACPVIAMPAFYTRTATVYDRKLWKMDKETFEKFDEAETTLHASIVESLSQGTIRTINTQHPAGISSLNALQLVEVMHTLYSTPTLQDITTVDNDLKHPLAHFEDFLDHVTDHINNYESLRSFNQPVSDITKIQTFKESSGGRNLTPSSPRGRSTTITFSNATSHSSPTTLSTNMATCLQTSNREAVMHTTSGSPENQKEKAKEKTKREKANTAKANTAKAKENTTKAKAADADDIPAHKRPRNDHQVSSAVNDMVDDAEEQQEETMSIHFRTSARSSASAAHQIHGSNASSPLTSSMSNPDPKLYSYCHFHGWNLTHAGPECRVMSNDAAYARAQKQATSPADTTPRGNDQIEPLQTDGLPP
jgi:hypothetical protein